MLHTSSLADPGEAGLVCLEVSPALQSGGLLDHGDGGRPVVILVLLPQDRGDLELAVDTTHWSVRHGGCRPELKVLLYQIYFFPLSCIACCLI